VTVARVHGSQSTVFSLATGRALFSGTGVTVEEVGFQSAAQITAFVKVAADAALTARTVTVINPDGGTGTLTNGFTAL